MKIASTETAAASGLHAFVYGKAKSNAARFTPQELDTKITELMTMHVRARAGEEEMESALERFILTL
jgi:hypothetical protein